MFRLLSNHPKKKVTAGDWERVMQAHQAETMVSAEHLRRLGPQVQLGEVVASVDEVQVRRPQKRRFLELGTAYVRTADSYRYLSGSIGLVLPQVFLLLVLCGGGCRPKSPCWVTGRVGSAASSRNAWPPCVRCCSTTVGICTG